MAFENDVAPKSLAEKARQQVKKSASVYANAVRPKPTPNPPVRLVPPKLVVPTPPQTICSVRRSPNDPASKCVVRNPGVVVKVVKVVKALPPDPAPGTVVRPSPFGSRAPPPPVRVIKPITPSRAPVASSSSTAAPLIQPPPALTPAAAAARKPSSLFMPKKKKPPPPAPSRSLGTMPAPSATTRMSAPPRK